MTQPIFKKFLCKKYYTKKETLLRLTHVFLYFAVAPLLSACITSNIVVNVDNRPEKLAGMAIGNFLTATFYAEDSTGLLCTGSYNWYDTAQYMEADFQCSDGRSGKAYIERYGDYNQHGLGEGVLSDGTKLQVYLGDEVKKYP